jgi:hypothetical protein
MESPFFEDLLTTKPNDKFCSEEDVNALVAIFSNVACSLLIAMPDQIKDLVTSVSKIGSH